MDRLISEQAVIESIKFFQMNPQHFDFLNLIDDIKEIPSAEPKTGWIPVSERLPEPDIEVLVTDDAGGLATIGTDSIYESEVTGEKAWYTSQNVTAWMSLPEPYRAESEDKYGRYRISN